MSFSPPPPVTVTATVSVKPSLPNASAYLSNTGNVPATINSVSPNPPAGFVVTYWVYSGARVQVFPNTSPVTLQPGASLEIQVGVVNNDYTVGSGSVTIFNTNSTQFTITVNKSTGQ
jgi:hypothetical protein